MIIKKLKVNHEGEREEAGTVRCFIDFSPEITLFFNFLIELLRAVFVYKVARRTSSVLVKSQQIKPDFCNGLGRMIT